MDADGKPYQVGGDTQYSDWSDETTVAINISPTVPTSGDDHFLWDGKAINGFGGEDTVQLRFGDSLGDAENKGILGVVWTKVSTTGDFVTYTIGGAVLKIHEDMANANNVIID